MAATAGFKMNFSDDDKGTEGRSAVYLALPTGDYECMISDAEIKEVKSGDNQGKSMLKVELTIQNNEVEEYNGRKFWCNVMLFDVEGGNWFIAMFLKATGNADALNTGNIPLPDAYLGKVVIATVKRLVNTYAMRGLPAGSPTIYKNEVKGFITDSSAAATPAAKKRNSMLP